MINDTAIYRANKFYGLPAFVILFLFIPALLNTEVALSSRLIGFGIFSFLAILVATIPLCAKLEIGDNYIKTYFLNFCILHLHAFEIQVMEYGNLFRGGLGFGKGLNIRALINGKEKTTSLGERFYGKQAIAHAKRVLESRES